jgi:hypothetical protein
VRRERWEALLNLEGGEHRHLDTLVEGAPPPGAIEWLSLIREVVAVLVETDEPWFVSFPLGQIDFPPDAPLTVEQAAQAASVDGLMEPPAVYRAGADLDHEGYDGDVVLLGTRAPIDGVVEVVQAIRSTREAHAGERWNVLAGFAIVPAASEDA